MATRLRIELEGDVPGLAEHRVSLALFGPALNRLLAATRRIASGLFRDAAGEHYGARGGRLKLPGEQLDIQVAAIEGQSPTALVIDFVQIPPAGYLFPDLPDLAERTANRLLDAIDRESRNQPDNIVVRRYLKELPAGLKGQRYVLSSRSGAQRVVSVGSMKLPELAPRLPELVEMTGAVDGVGFPPGRTEVRMRTMHRDVTCSATAEQVDQALSLRDARVHALAVRGEGSMRLLHLWREGSERPAVRYDPARDVFGRWHSLLERLAK